MHFGVRFLLQNCPTPPISTLSLHDALPICSRMAYSRTDSSRRVPPQRTMRAGRSSESGPTLMTVAVARSEEHTSELQSQSNLVCRLLLEKKKRQRSYPRR